MEAKVIKRETERRGGAEPNLTQPERHKETDTKCSGGAPITERINWAIKETNRAFKMGEVDHKSQMKHQTLQPCWLIQKRTNHFLERQSSS